MGRQVAVIGSGVAGLTAAYALTRSPGGTEVTLYEAAERLGGHAHTHDVDDPVAGTLAVDTGFIVHNRRTYPTLLRLFAELDVPTQESDMSMSVVCEGCGLQYAGARGLSGLLARPGYALRGRYLRMLTEVPRFHRHAHRVLAAGPGDTRTLGEVLAQGRYSPFFVSHFMAPLVAAVWSCAPGTALDYPARYLFSFLDHHGMLAVTGSPTWRTVTGGSRTYVERVAKTLAAVCTATPVRSVRRDGGGVGIEADEGVRRFDAVVIATHPDAALAMLADPTDAEREVLGAIPYSRNDTVLHTDDSVLPSAPRARASWNYRANACAGDATAVRVSYDMNRLQRLPAGRPYVVTLNGAGGVDPGRVLARMVYDHPIYTPSSVAARQRLPALSGPVVAFAGAYHGWGFHEDGARSGRAAAHALGATW